MFSFNIGTMQFVILYMFKKIHVVQQLLLQEMDLVSHVQIMNKAVVLCPNAHGETLVSIKPHSQAIGIQLSNPSTKGRMYYKVNFFAEFNSKFSLFFFFFCRPTGIPSLKSIVCIIIY